MCFEFQAEMFRDERVLSDNKAPIITFNSNERFLPLRLYGRVVAVTIG